MDISGAFDLGLRSAQREFHALNNAATTAQQYAVSGSLHQLGQFISLADQAFDAFVRFEAIKRVAERCGYDCR